MDVIVTKEEGSTPSPETQGSKLSKAQKNRRAKKRRKNRRKLYKVDNTQLAEGLVPVEEFLPDWVAPAETREKNKKSCRGDDVQVPAHIAPLDTGECGELKVRIMDCVQRKKKPLSSVELAGELKSALEKVEFAVGELVDDRELFRSRKNRVGNAEQMGLIAGKLQVTSGGFAFVLSETDDGDLYVAGNKLSGAINGDRVLAKIIGERAGNKEGEVVSITERANSKIIGTVELAKGKPSTLIPDDRRKGSSYPITKGALGGAKQGQKVVCEIDYKPVVPQASVVEVLGFEGEKGTDVLSIIRSRDIPDKFPPQVVRAARKVPEEVAQDDILRREDLRKTTVFTIDGEDAKDFDDAVSLEILTNGNYYLGVHIADVSHYVKEGGALDKEAIKRGTSVYLADRVIPMLPVELSNGICSLNPKQDRLALSCFMEIDAKGVVVNHRISETVINSKYRLIYEDVTAMLAGDKALRKAHRPIVKTLDNMLKLSELLRQNRQKRGALDFDLPESKIILDDSGAAIDVKIYERGASNMMIEDFMLVCNETVAEHMAYLERPMMYRVHELPSEERMKKLNDFLGTLGLRVKGAVVKPKSLQAIITAVKGKPEEQAVSQMLLRSLQKARYCEQNLGHFGLAASFYCHFTSPIRRYPDLEVHRIIKEILHASLSAKREQELDRAMPELAQQCSERERAAMEAEREVADLKKCEYMANHIGELYMGRVSGMMGGGIYVMLPNSCEGFVKNAALGNEFFVYDEARNCAVGKSSGFVIRLGDQLQVKVQGANLSTHKVELKAYTEEPTGRRARKPKK